MHFSLLVHARYAIASLISWIFLAVQISKYIYCIFFNVYMKDILLNIKLQSKIDININDTNYTFHSSTGYRKNLTKSSYQLNAIFWYSIMMTVTNNIMQIGFHFHNLKQRSARTFQISLHLIVKCNCKRYLSVTDQFGRIFTEQIISNIHGTRACKVNAT